MKVTLIDVQHVFDIAEPHTKRHLNLLGGETVLRSKLVASVQPADAVRPIRLAVDELESGEERVVRGVYVVYNDGTVDLGVVGGAFDE